MTDKEKVELLAKVLRRVTQAYLAHREQARLGPSSAIAEARTTLRAVGEEGL